MSNGCQHPPEELCPRCRLPLCWRCSTTMLDKSGSRVVPMGLCNDNLWGYTTDVISKYQVRWIETAIVSPCWTTMLVYYVEGDRGHLMGEEVGQQQFRTKVRGTSCSFHMPWEDILADLKKNCMDGNLLEIPRPEECVKYMLRAHITVGGVDLKKNLKQLHVRPYVLLLLLDFLIDRNHEVFRGKGSALELKERMREAVERHYPEKEAHVPEGQRQGSIPPSILQALRAAESERQEATAAGALSCKRLRITREKHGTPGHGARCHRRPRGRASPRDVPRPKHSSLQ